MVNFQWLHHIIWFDWFVTERVPSVIVDGVLNLSSAPSRTSVGGASGPPRAVRPVGLMGIRADLSVPRVVCGSWLELSVRVVKIPIAFMKKTFRRVIMMEEVGRIGHFVGL